VIPHVPATKIAAAACLVLGWSAVASAADLQSGLQLLHEKKYAEAEKELHQVAAAEPDNAQAKVGLAEAYLMQNKLDEASAELDAAEKQAPDDAAVHKFRGMLLMKRDQYQAAYDQLSKAVELDPKDAYAHYYLGMAAGRVKKSDQMVKHFQIFLKLAPDAPEAAKVKSLLRAL
jgi:Tfp pilus assembly protein PilF